MANSNVSCSSGKQTFFDRAFAKKTAKVLGRKNKVRLSAYLCPECGFFHLTSYSAQKIGFMKDIAGN